MDFQKHIQAFITTFIRKSRQDRWKVLVSLNRFDKLNLAEFQMICVEKYCRTWKGDWEQLLTISPFQSFLFQEVVILRGAHDPEPGVYSSTLKEFFKLKHFFEGFISIIPGQLALVFDHEGSITICDSSAERNV